LFFLKAVIFISCFSSPTIATLVPPTDKTMATLFRFQSF
jgi:hypothetical protein